MMSRTTRWRISKGLSPGLGKAYHTKNQMPGMLKDPENVMSIASSVFYRNFRLWEELKDDLIAEGILRCVELAGKSQEPKFLFSVCKNAMFSYIQKWAKGGIKSEIPISI